MAGDTGETEDQPINPLATIAAQHAMSEYLTADQVVEDGETVVMLYFAKRVVLTLDAHRRVQYLPGLNQVPERLAGNGKDKPMHWYLVANGVTAAPGAPAKRAAPQQPQPGTADTGDGGTGDGGANTGDTGTGDGDQPNPRPGKRR